MSYGITSSLSNSLLNAAVGNSSYVAPAVWAQLHIGDPSASGTANLSLVTTRQQVFFGTPSGGSIALSTATNPPSWNMTGYPTGGGETITAISLWTAATSGTVLWDVALTSSQPVTNGSTLTLLTLTLSLGPLSV